MLVTGELVFQQGQQTITGRVLGTSNMRSIRAIVAGVKEGLFSVSAMVVQGRDLFFFLGGGDLITGADIAYAAHRETNLKILFIRTRGAYEIQISVDASRVDADVLAAVPVLGDVPVEEGHLSRRRQIESRLSQISRGGTSALAGTQPITLPKNIEVSELMTYGGFGRHRDHCGTAIDGKRMLKPCFPCGRNVHFQCHRKRIGPRNQNAPVGCRFTTQVRFTGQDSRP